MTKGKLNAFARLISATLALFVSLCLGYSSASADTTAETGISVVLTEAGTLDVQWGGDGFAFTFGGENAGPTASEPAIATATLLIVVHDTRADADRSGYTIAVASAGFTSADTATSISPDLLMVTDLTGSPDSNAAQYLIGSTFASPVTVLSVEIGAPAVDTTIAVTVRMTIPSGTQPGSYTGAFTLDVTPSTTPSV
jgi:hypothetical protein